MENEILELWKSNMGNLYWIRIPLSEFDPSDVIGETIAVLRFKAWK